MANPVDSGSRIDRPAMPAGGKLEARTGVGENDGMRRDPGVGADESRLSDRLQAVERAIASTPEVDQARVDALRERIASGEYPIDADRLASRFIEFEQLLGEESK